MKYAWMRSQQTTYSVRAMCRVLQVSHSGFYAWRDRPLSERAHANVALSQQIVQLHQATREAYGSERLWRALQAQGFVCGRHRVRRLRRLHHILTKRRRRQLRGRSSYQREVVASRLITWPFQAAKQDVVWVTDITFIPTQQGWLYLAVIVDVYSRKVIGWAMSSQPNQMLVSKALEMAIAQRKPKNGTIHHSDQGVQYTSKVYRQQLEDNGLRMSMSRKGMPYDNAVAESFFSSLKNELTHHERFKTLDEARYKIFGYIEVFYNRQRQHSSLGYHSPEQFERLQCVA